MSGRHAGPRERAPDTNTSANGREPHQPPGDLPNVDELRAAGLLDARPASTLGEAAPDAAAGDQGGYAGEEEDPL